MNSKFLLWNLSWSLSIFLFPLFKYFLLVCWFAGLLVCWFVGLLVCWFVGLFFVFFVLLYFIFWIKRKREEKKKKRKGKKLIPVLVLISSYHLHLPSETGIAEEAMLLSPHAISTCISPFSGISDPSYTSHWITYFSSGGRSEDNKPLQTTTS